MSAQVRLPVKKKIHWKGFIKLLSLHSVQMDNWPRNLTLEDVFLLDYSRKDTTFWDALWVACQDDSMHQLGLRRLPSGTDVLVVDESGHTLLTVAHIRKCWVRANRALRGLDGSIAPRGLRA